jgi:ABC-type taurine transport system substrate-binding protein
VTQQKDDVGSRTISPFVRVSGTYYFGSMFACQTDYTTSQVLFELNPSTTAAWTNSDINALYAGLKITA